MIFISACIYHINIRADNITSNIYEFKNEGHLKKILSLHYFFLAFILFLLYFAFIKIEHHTPSFSRVKKFI